MMFNSPEDERRERRKKEEDLQKEKRILTLLEDIKRAVTDPFNVSEIALGNGQTQRSGQSGGRTYWHLPPEEGGKLPCPYKRRLR